MPNAMSRWVLPVPESPMQHDGVAGVEVAAGGERGDGRRVDRRGGVEVEVGESFDAWEAGFVNESATAAFGTVVDLDG